ncbi:MAG: hypothetical protein Q9163_003618 [Psora crenata]
MPCRPIPEFQLPSLDIRAGQLWIPSISFWSFLQSHPFTIASWGNSEKNTSLDLLIEPRKGFTQKLYACGENYSEKPGKGTDTILQEPASTAINQRISQDILDELVEQEGRSTALDSQQSWGNSFKSTELKQPGRTETSQRPLEEAAANAIQPKFGYKSYEGEPQSSDFRLAIFSGPHGTGVSVGDYGKVLMIAVGFGIAAQLPYLKELVRGFNNYQVLTREVRLIWQLQSFAYYKSGDLAKDPMTVGRYGRLTYKKGTMDLSKLLDDQLLPRSADGKETMLVTVSANEQVRDELRDLAQSRLDKISLLELEYQPTEKRRFLEFLVEK